MSHLISAQRATLLWATALCILAWGRISVSSSDRRLAEASVQAHHLADLPDDGLLDAAPIPWQHLALAATETRAARQLLAEEEGGAGGKRSSAAPRCRMTRGSWCEKFERQVPEATRLPPHGDKSCPGDCSGVGNCNHDSGLCDCPAGWTGVDCSQVLSRACTNGYRKTGSQPLGHIDANGRDLDWQQSDWTPSRCPGICDDVLAVCYCDNPTHGYIPPPHGSPPGTRPVQYGRMLGQHCAPLTTWDNKTVPWGKWDYSRLYGETGWCNATHPSRSPHDNSCGCILDGYHGKDCAIESEHACPNQCGGRGNCYLGFCKCPKGWYGSDCSRRRVGQAFEPNDVAKGVRPWLAGVVADPPASLDTPALPTRKRPFIYIYDLPAEFNARMLQWRVQRDGCVYRRFSPENGSYAIPYNLYAVEMLLHETLLQSEHRTFDPEEADFFYVPVYVTCLINPVSTWADTPWYHGPLLLRVLQAANFLADTHKWIRNAHPWWDRRQGRDHIWLAAHDEGACWMPTEIYNTSIILTHWGRMDPDHTSNTAYGFDNYTLPFQHPEWQPRDWREIYAGHACYTPGKDLVIPSFKVPEQYKDSPLMGAPWKQRDILLLFRGDVGTARLPWYSRGIRQQLYNAAQQHNWTHRYNIRIGFPHDPQVQGQYGELLSRTKFALVAPGDGWSARAEDAVLHGCIPVVIMDNVHAVFESILDWDSFSVRIAEKSLLDLPEILLAIPADKVARMQRRVARVWTRFAWASGPFMGGLNSHWHSQVLEQTAGQPTAMTKGQGLRAVRKPWPVHQDAFSTIISWLYSRIPETR